jgi:hypothetical protein
MKLRLEGLDLLHQPVNELLGAAHGQRRNVIDRLLGIQLRALSAWYRQRIDDVRTDTEQAKLEYLKQAARTRTDDDDVGRNFAQTPLPLR